jgi:hypothetical protein
MSGRDDHVDQYNAYARLPTRGATYTGPDGREWTAYQASEPTPWGGQLVEKGDWMATGPDLKKYVIQGDHFRKHYAQKYPRPVDGGDAPQAIAPTAA